MKMTFRVILLAVLAVLALAACSSGAATPAAVQEERIAPVDDNRPAEASDSPIQRPKFLNSFASW